MKRPRLAVYKFASCDGCQLQILNAETELLTLAELVDIAYFPEARSHLGRGPFDVGLVEGSITTAADARRIQVIRREVDTLVTIGACATTGGIQALRNWADVEEYKRAVYPNPDWLETLGHSTAIAEHVAVDFELPGCPIDRGQLLEVLRSLLVGVRPSLPRHSVCLTCKQKGIACLAVTRQEPCLGPVTRTGCGAICPQMGRGCYGCFGPAEGANVGALVERFRSDGMAADEAVRRLRGFTGYAPAFREASNAIEDDE